MTSLRKLGSDCLRKLVTTPLFRYVARHAVGEELIEIVHGQKDFSARARSQMSALSSLSQSTEAFLDFLGLCARLKVLSHSQIQQDLWALFMTKERRNGYFVEFGASDGLMLSNTFALAKYFGWRGLLIEPGQQEYAKLVKNRPESTCVFGVVGASEGEVEFAYTPDSPLAATLPNFVRSDQHSKIRERNIHMRRVPSYRLVDLLNRAEAPKVIDFMSVDTEGSEHEILSHFDFDAYDVQLLVVEHNHTEKEAMIDHLLAGKGYQRIWPEFSAHDGWYFKP